MENYDVVIIGAGAAGLFCAIEAGRRGRKTLLIDHARAVGEKIRISGGGRCNFTNLEISPEKFISANPRFAVSALVRYTQWDFIDRIANAGIAYHEKTLGQLFCDGSAKEIIGMLLDDLAEANVDLLLETSIEDIEKDGDYRVTHSHGCVDTQSLVIATGGKSIPKMGASGFGYIVAENFGIPVLETVPALVPLTFGEKDLEHIKPLAGISVSASISSGATSFDEGMLFTHRGLSGPSILQISSYWKPGGEIVVNLAAGQNVLGALIEQRAVAGKISLSNALAAYLPKKLATDIVGRSGKKGNLADQSDKSLSELVGLVHQWHVKPTGSEGYRTAEVTLGGVDTNALNSKTMEAKSCAGLYFIGEVVDVTGWLGGYNFQWAWSSGWAAGQVV
jgi:predicted Rossmann fold flavoprotein